jgi:hypothetical protein
MHNSAGDDSLYGVNFVNFVGLGDPMKSMSVVPEETDSEGVRRRGRTMGIIFGLMIAGALITYSAYSVLHSVWSVVAVAMLSGMAASRLDIRLDPPSGELPERSDKLRWLLWIAPLLILLGGATIYSALHVGADADIFETGLLAGFCGWVLGFTLIIVGDGLARARAEDTTLTTSGNENRP